MVFAPGQAVLRRYFRGGPISLRDAHAASPAELAEAGDFPFDGTWCDLRPDPAWPPLARPDGLERPRA